MKVRIGRKTIVIDPKRLLTVLTILVIIVPVIAVTANNYTIKTRDQAASATAHASTNSRNPEAKTPAPAQDTAIDTNSEDNNDHEDNKPVPPSPPVEADKDYRSFFKKDLFLGDSITEGLAFYEFVGESNVIAELGLTLVKMEQQLDRAEQMKPENIFLLFGTNDISATITDQQFLDNYIELIRAIKTRLPDTDIYIQSILPVSPEIEAERPYLNHQRLNELNADLARIAKKEGVQYLDITRVLQDSDQNLYEPDGIHFRRDFYPLWLNYLIESNVK